MTDISADAGAYYAGGFRRTCGGVPCKVFSRRTKDGRYINAKDSPFYVAEFDHPTKGGTRLASDQCEIFPAVASVAEAEPCDIALAVDAEPATVEPIAEPSNVVAVDFSPALAAANDEGYSISEARYAKGQMAVRYTSSGPYKDRVQRLVGDGLNARWSGREGAYIASPAKAAKFVRLYAGGFDASSFTGDIYHPERRDLGNLTIKEALAAAAAVQGATNAAPALTIIRGGFGSTAQRYRHPSIQREEINMPHIAPESPASERDTVPAPMPEVAPVVALPAPEPIPPFKGLRAILAARDSLQARRGRGAARERLLRRYLAMRKQRAMDRLTLAAAGDAAREAALAVETQRARLERFEAAAAQVGEPDRLGFGANDHLQYGAQRLGFDRDGYKVFDPTKADECEVVFENASLPLVAMIHEERDRRKAVEASVAAREEAFDAATDRLAAKLEEMTGRALRAEAEVRRGKMAPALFCGSTVATARLAGGRLQ